MLKKEQRLNLSDLENLQILERGQTKFFRSSYFFLYLREKRKTSSRFSALVPKKLFSQAIKRNQYRRFLYQLLEESLDKLTNFEGVLLLKSIPRETKMNFKEIKKSLTEDFLIILQKI